MLQFKRLPSEILSEFNDKYLDSINFNIDTALIILSRGGITEEDTIAMLGLSCKEDITPELFIRLIAYVAWWDRKTSAWRYDNKQIHTKPIMIAFNVHIAKPAKIKIQLGQLNMSTDTPTTFHGYVQPSEPEYDEYDEYTQMLRPAHITGQRKSDMQILAGIVTDLRKAHNGRPMRKGTKPQTQIKPARDTSRGILIWQVPKILNKFMQGAFTYDDIVAVSGVSLDTFKSTYAPRGAGDYAGREQLIRMLLVDCDTILRSPSTDLGGLLDVQSAQRIVNLLCKSINKTYTVSGTQRTLAPIR
jgi:hypothetical protein